LDGLSKELDGVLAQISREHDVVPFMAQVLPPADAVFQPLPLDMLEVLRASPDYQSVRPGEQPTWLQIATDDVHVELIVYRAEVDGKHYVLAPRERA
jgi:hypothetical protein